MISSFHTLFKKLVIKNFPSLKNSLPSLEDFLYCFHQNGQEGCLDVVNITKQESVPKSTYNIANSNNEIAIAEVIFNKQWRSVQEFISLVNGGVI